VRDGDGDAHAHKWDGDRHRSRCDSEKPLIEAAYRQDVLPVGTEDEAGPYQTLPSPGSQWHPTGTPVRCAHEYVREGTAKQLTLVHPASGEVRVKGVRSCPNAVLHPWREAELTAILDRLPEPTEGLRLQESRRRWACGQEGRSVRITLPQAVPPLRMLVVLDNLSGHDTVAFVRWLFAHGSRPLSTPRGGSYVTMAASVQRIRKRRARAGQHPQTPAEIIAWLEAAARGWNREPTPLVWGGKRQARRQRARERRHAVGGSGAYTRRPLHRSRAV
jgi:hypothetical protein